jgi:hypothetical protein
VLISADITSGKDLWKHLCVLKILVGNQRVNQTQRRELRIILRL